MKAERVILSFIALIVGLAVAGLAFYFYQMAKTIPDTKIQSQSTTRAAPTPTPDEKENFLSVDSPKDDDIVTTKTITISGKANKDATIIVTSESDQQVVKPSQTGDFSLTQTIGDGANLFEVTAILPDGQEKRVLKTITYSTETF